MTDAPGSPYGPAQADKERTLFGALADLTRLHYQRCEAYRNIVDALGAPLEAMRRCEDIPFFPVSLFKDLELRSVPREEVFKVLTSSGTTGQAVSRMYLDRATASAQQKVLAHIVTDFMGASRLPMLIIDCPSVLTDRNTFSARGAGVLGFSIFGADRTYALNDDMSLNREAVDGFCQRHAGRDILLFGFTFMIWKHFCQPLLASATRPDLSRGVLFHGGGWKKMESEAVTSDIFRQRLGEACGLRRVHSYYGMVEQTGSIYVECEQGRLHASVYSDVIIRRHRDFSCCAEGEPGIIQVLSELPRSYPGHSLLTEDQGILLGEDDCPCGRKGRSFQVLGRLKSAEIRGCSDTYEQRV